MELDQEQLQQKLQFQKKSLYFRKAGPIYNKGLLDPNMFSF